jgi:hypothetical protein
MTETEELGLGGRLRGGAAGELVAAAYAAGSAQGPRLAHTLLWQRSVLRLVLPDRLRRLDEVVEGRVLVAGRAEIEFLVLCTPHSQSQS